MKRFALVLVLAFSTACASTGAIQTATIAEHGIVQAVHVAVQSEATAYTAGAFGVDQHRANVAALKKVTSGEAALNAALMTWAANVGQPAPAAVSNAIKALAPILADVAPLIGTSGPAAAFVADLTAVLTALDAPAATPQAVTKKGR